MDSTTTISDNSNTIMNKPVSYVKTGLGERLKATREALRLTEKDVAARLHLNIAVIYQLENEDFEDGTPATFLRGYLRSYAKLLNVPENEIALTLKNLENSSPCSVNAISITQMKPQKNNERYLNWLTYVIVLVLIMLVSVWWNSHSRYAISDVPPQVANPIKTVTPSMPVVNNAPTAAEPAHTAPVANPSTPETLAQPAAPLQKPAEPTTMPAATATTTTQTIAVTPTPATNAAANPAAPTAQTNITTPPAGTNPAMPTTGINPAMPITGTPATPETIASGVTTPSKPAKKSKLSHLRMALPEPDGDYSPDE